MYFNRTPERVKQINDLMQGQITDQAKQGYSINVSGHSLGGSLALFICTDNSWVNHCEVHNPYLDDVIINKLNLIFNKNGINDKIIIQETKNDFVSQHFPALKLNVTYNVFYFINNVKGLGTHSPLSLFAKSFLEVASEIKFDSQIIIVQDLIEFENLCKEKIEQYLQIVSQCQENEYYSFSTLACLDCPAYKSCKDNFLGPFNGPPSLIETASGDCKNCPSGTYISEFEKNKCNLYLKGSFCVNSVKNLCSPWYIQQ
ncbi:hypothetical protein ABPG72_006846 [Tetrahymena utriculariae]